MGWVLSFCRLTQSVELHAWTVAKGLSLDFPRGASFCRIWGHPKVACRLQNIVVVWRKPRHLYVFMLPSAWLSKWSFTLIWPEQSSAIWKYGVFTQCIKAEYTHLFLNALKMFLPLHFTVSLYLTSECESTCLHYCWVVIHSFHGIILSFWEAIEYLNRCDTWTDSLAGFLCWFPRPVPWSITLTG